MTTTNQRVCVKCGKELETKDIKCPACGAPQVGKGCLTGCAIIIGVSVLLGLIVALTYKDETPVNIPATMTEAVRQAPPRIDIPQSSYDQIKVGMPYGDVVRIVGTAGKLDATTESPDPVSGRKVKDEIYIWMTPYGLVGVNVFDGKVLSKYHNSTNLKQDPVPL